jgi:hypothetical protein
MKSNRIENNNQSNQNAFTAFCASYCQKLLSEIQRARQEILAHFRNAFSGQEQLLRLALNEAEAMAFLTEYPHLVFPDLAMEKVQSAAKWSHHQQQLGRIPMMAARL